MLKKIGVTMLLIVIVVCSCLVVSGCTSNTGKIQKYDVSIKIGRIGVDKRGNKRWWDILDEWIFTPDIEELHIEIPYDGKRYGFFVLAYNMPDHPEYGNEWLAPHNFCSSDSYNSYGYPIYPSTVQLYNRQLESSLYMLRPYGNTGFIQPKYVEYVYEVGNYEFCVHTDDYYGMTDWNRRRIHLTIHVTEPEEGFEEPEEPDIEPEEGYEEPEENYAVGD